MNQEVPKGEILDIKVEANLSLIRDLFIQTVDFAELRNPHVENLVSPDVRQQAAESAVLIPIIDDVTPRLMVTKRQTNIRFAGHLCFPGGRSDPGDKSGIETALRESAEEINIAAQDVEILGCLGHYYTQAGYKITPVVGIIQHPARVEANPSEVDSIYEVDLAKVLDPGSYKLTWQGDVRAHFSYSERDIRIAGPTVSLMIGLLETLARFTNHHSRMMG